jgi:hypothetical protein
VSGTWTRSTARTGPEAISRSMRAWRREVGREAKGALRPRPQSGRGPSSLSGGLGTLLVPCVSTDSFC